MKRYAFIDVQNTDSTAQNMLGFIIDWSKVVDWLKNKKSCVEVLLYSGIANGDTETAQEFDALSKISGCTVKTKTVMVYKNKDKTITAKCPNCSNDCVHIVDMGYRRKSNCDVELSVDVMNKSGDDVEFYIFTGDGDFEYLIRKALEKGVKKVSIVSYAGKDIKAGITVTTYSTKLRELVDEKRDCVYYISLRDIMDLIKKTS